MKVAITVSGKVQGVGFRYTTLLLAMQMDIKGIVKNEVNGDVYIEAMGEEKKVKEFIEKIKKSPAPFGRVDRITLDSSIHFKDYDDFKVVY